MRPYQDRKSIHTSDGVRIAVIIHSYTIPPVPLCSTKRSICLVEEFGNLLARVPLGYANAGSNVHL